MRTKTNVNAGRGSTLPNHNEILVRDNSKNLKVRTNVRAGKKAK